MSIYVDVWNALNDKAKLSVKVNQVVHEIHRLQNSLVRPDQLHASSLLMWNIDQWLVLNGSGHW